jgi:Glycosyl hydrolases family 17
MSKIWDAVCSAGFQGKIMVSTAVSSDVFDNTYPPSRSVFKASYNMGPIVNFLAATGNPLFVNIYPYFSYKINYPQIGLDYALFTASGTVVRDDPYQYQNLFDAMVDSVYYALEKAGGSKVGIVVSESGWPSAGDEKTGTTIANAQTYNQKLINHVANGTPKKPGNLETYIFAMFNENKKTGDEVERHFGLFYPNQSPVYSISFN